MQLLRRLNAISFNMKYSVLIFLLLLLGCGIEEESKIEGTWQLVSAKTITKDSTFSTVSPNQEMIKIINKTHFSFLRHDLNKGKDSSAVYVAGGGRYVYKKGVYKEYLDYLNYREWEGKVFEFNAKINNDTLIITGVEKIEELGVDNKIIEVYKKL
ncbi:conserved hypothetical protein [Tenacibaculum halocynthiae]|nr:hypothetical protein SAMN04487765_0651 [Tenacibaculum sp. MAR_2010_89]